MYANLCFSEDEGPLFVVRGSNIVPVYQFGDDPQRDQPFYVMRFLGKKTLAD